MPLEPNPQDAKASSFVFDDPGSFSQKFIDEQEQASKYALGRPLVGGATLGGDLVGAVVGAPMRASASLYNTVDWMLGNALPDLDAEYEWFEPKTVAGGLLAGLGEAAALAGVGSAVGVGGGVSSVGRGTFSVARTVSGARNAARVANLAKWSTSGAALDFVMGREGAGISNALAQLPDGLLSDIGKVLATEADDTELTRRLKSMVEGFFVGAAGDAVVAGIKRSWRATLGAPGREALGKAYRREAIDDQERLFELMNNAQAEANRAAYLDAISEGRGVEFPDVDRLREADFNRAELAKQAATVQAAEGRAVEDAARLQQASAGIADRPSVEQAELQEAFPGAFSGRTREAPIEVRPVVPRETIFDQAGRINREGYARMEAELGPETRTTQAAEALQRAGRRMAPAPAEAQSIYQLIDTDETVRSVERKLAARKPPQEAFLEALQEQLEAKNRRPNKPLERLRSEGSTVPVEGVQGAVGREAFESAARRMGADPKFIADLVDAVGPEILNRVQTASVSGRGGAFVRAATDLIVLGDRAASGNRVAAEELFHSMERLLSPKERADIQAQFDRVRPTAGAEYKYTNASEFWVHTAVERAVGRATASQTPGFKGMALRLWQTIERVFNAVARKVGYRQAQAIADEMLAGGARGRERSGELLSGRRAAFSEEGINRDILRVFDQRTALESIDEVAQMVADPKMQEDVVPHRMRVRDRLLQKVEKGFTTTFYSAMTRDLDMMRRHTEAMIEKVEGLENRPMTMKQIRAEAAANLSDVNAMVDLGDPQELIARITKATDEEAAQLRRTHMANRSLLLGFQQQVLDAASQVTNNSAIWHAADKERAAARFVFIKNLEATMTKIVRGTSSEAGRILRTQQEAELPGGVAMAQRVTEALESPVAPKGPVTAQQVIEAKGAREPVRTMDQVLDDPKERQRLIREGGGLEAIQRTAATVQTIAKNESDAVIRAQKVQKILDQINAAPSMSQMLANLGIRQILAIPTIPIKVLLSQTISAGWLPSEMAIGGGALRYYFQHIKKNSAQAEKMNSSIRVARMTYGYMTDPETLQKAFNAYKLAFNKQEGVLFSNDFAGSNVGKNELNARNLEAWRKLHYDINAKNPAIQSIYAKDGLLMRIMGGIATYSSGTKPPDGGLSSVNRITGGAVEYGLGWASTRPLNGVDEATRVWLSDTTAKAILTDQAMRNFPDGSVDIAAHVNRKMDLLFHKGSIISAQRLERDGLEQAAKQGISDPIKAQVFAEDYAKRMMAENPELMDLAKLLEERADEAAGTLPYDDSVFGKVASALDYGLSKAGLPKLILPFVRTSYSLVKSAGQRFDLPGVIEWAGIEMQKFDADSPERMAAMKSAHHRFTQDMLSGDPIRQAAAAGRIATGFLIFSGFGAFAAWGRTEKGLPLMTGALSRDPAMRANQQRAGMQEYSFWVPGVGYMSYSWMEPFSTLLGSVADVVTAAEVNPQAREPLGIVASLTVAFANNVVNKSYMLGLAQLHEAVARGDSDKLTKLLDRSVVSLTPLAGLNGIGWAGRAGERMATGASPDREVRSLVDAYLVKLPYFRQDLPVSRNILGEPVESRRYIDFGLFSPATVQYINDDVVDSEFLSLGHPFHMPQSMRRDLGVDLMEVDDPNGGSAYDTWMRTTGEISLDGRNLRSALRALIKSPQYKSLPIEDPLGGESPRVREVQRVLNRYRTTAYLEMLKRIPALAKVQQAASTRRASVRAQRPVPFEVR